MIPINEMRSTNCCRRSASITRASWLSARGLELQITKLAVSALELALVTERGRVLDLPNPLKCVN